MVLDVVFTSLLLKRIVGINDKVKQIDISSRQREKELTMKDVIASSKEDRENLDKYFVGAGNAMTLEFTKYLENLAKEIGVTQRKTLDYENISGLSATGQVSNIRYKFNVSGKWNNVFNFIRAIETLPNAVSINSLNLSLNSGVASLNDARSASRVWTVDLDFSVARLDI